jgi:hypothetical protein
VFDTPASAGLLAGLELAIVADKGCQGPALGQMPCGVAIALRFGAGGHVLDYGPAQQRCRERMGALQRPRGGIERIVSIAINLGVPIEDEAGRLSRRGPCMK